METIERLEDQKREGQRRGIGVSAIVSGILSFTPEGEQLLMSMPVDTSNQDALQNANGTFRFRPLDDGTLEAGAFGIDSYGRFVAV